MKEHARDPATALPDPRGRKSLPSMLSSTNDFPELCPPTTAMAGSASQSEPLPPPWSSRMVHARAHHSRIRWHRLGIGSDEADDEVEVEAEATPAEELSREEQTMEAAAAVAASPGPALRWFAGAATSLGLASRGLVATAGKESAPGR